ncbi:HAD family hydrolase [Clostridium pasteurianum DSM 525 = ATCC 6013]|uniref:HAD family hydrolase n=1 Tax=Clostridium pasteurianum DSM 525 = ATCC 6013 TaxID=1262449 RepID=A0A0H3J4H8_CLOPA|nr:HAD family hydrolase [Clostridium pasteurianum]AJA47822.1 HAD family hydrolase [Clostridium pasteurianum DSM 525 = ATCC 6013]AJA51810.1 HAD family hydrolase [Clostridium pasteurianum DSM 525 = ATCC 6013]AOZ75114.1 HAD family hydrolase [Clostridium pasteurianum DSM 525 = ATCC 6013]AOZ78909.1 HAD family hydrolase [Clostridium pasteurianum]ELP59723.1 HAD family hydrolase [Clostridium pasteurianum DSM 525 = ATCC 6013]
MEKLAIFDIDYTLTKRETLFEFYMFLLKKKPHLIIHMPKGTIVSVLYALGIVEAAKAKSDFMTFIKGIHEDEIRELAKEFYRKRFSKIFYTDAINTLKRLKAQGYKIYLISASAEFYLNELYNIKEVDKVIGTRFKFVNGYYTGEIIGENNKGEEKVRRLMEVLKEENIEVDFKESYMYSDSLADLPLLKLVGHPYLINSRKKINNIEILHWK